MPTETERTVEASMLEALLGDAERLDTVIDPRDEMMVVLAGAVGGPRARFDYFRLGAELLRTVEQIVGWAFPGERESISILEFACGYGRNLRHLVRRFRPERLTASDIDADAVAFVAERFGVGGKLSHAEPERLGWQDRYDLIVVPSLFSHLPHATFSRWLAALRGLLTERGVLAFSVHGAHLMPEGDFSSGILFRRESEAAGRLDTAEYGSTYVTERYVADQIEAATGARRYGRVPRGFWDFQDVYLVTGLAQRDPQSFRYEPPIMGHVDSVECAEGNVVVAGWAHAVQPGLTVRVRAGDDVLLELDRFEPRGDVAHVRGPEFFESGFAATLALPRAAAEPLLLVVDAEAAKETRCLYAVPLLRGEQPGRRRARDRWVGRRRGS